jgi:hypothetical protein
VPEYLWLTASARGPLTASQLSSSSLGRSHYRTDGAMHNFLIYLAGAGSYLFVTPASIFVLMNEHSRWIQALEAAALLLCTAVSILLLAGAGVLKLVKSMQDRV